MGVRRVNAYNRLRGSCLKSMAFPHNLKQAEIGKNNTNGLREKTNKENEEIDHFFLDCLSHSRPLKVVYVFLSFTSHALNYIQLEIVKSLLTVPR